MPNDPDLLILAQAVLRKNRDSTWDKRGTSHENLRQGAQPSGRAKSVTNHNDNPSVPLSHAERALSGRSRCPLLRVPRASRTRPLAASDPRRREFPLLMERPSPRAWLDRTRVVWPAFCTGAAGGQLSATGPLRRDRIDLAPTRPPSGSFDRDGGGDPRGHRSPRLSQAEQAGSRARRRQSGRYGAIT